MTARPAGAPGGEAVHGERTATLRRELHAARFTVDRLAALLGPEAEAALGRGDRVPARRALTAAGREPAALLGRLFLLGEQLQVGAAEQEEGEALSPALLDALIGLGLAARSQGRLRAVRDLRPYAFEDELGAGHWWIVSDLGELGRPGPLPTDHVLGVGAASLTLAAALLPGRYERALDLGTGCGIQAMHLSRRARRVVATDVSERAVQTAALNAELNGIRSIELRRGDVFEPVRGERFDLIVSNPPFVITPRNRAVPQYVYRDGGREADGLVREVVSGVAELLEPGGVAQLLGNWEYRPGEEGPARVMSWLGGAEVDLWLIERERVGPAQYAETWVRDGGTSAGAAYESLLEAWLQDFAARGVQAVGMGSLLLRRRAAAEEGAPLRRVDRPGQPLPIGTALGAHLAECLAAQRWLAANDDAAFAAATLVVAPDVTEERHYRPGSADPSAILLRQGGGFRRVVDADTVLAGVVGACDGELPVGSLLAGIASLLDADPVAVREAALPGLRELVASGMLRVSGLA